MRLLFKNTYYAVNASFWTAVEYRLAYCESVLDIAFAGGDDFVNNLVRLLYVALDSDSDGDKPDFNALLEEARNPDGHFIYFCNLLYEKIMKKDMLLEKYIKDYTTAAQGTKSAQSDKSDGADRFDELDILEVFMRTGYPERLLYVASYMQVIGLIVKYADAQSGGANGGKTEIKEMSMSEIKNFYGVK